MGVQLVLIAKGRNLSWKVRFKKQTKLEYSHYIFSSTSSWVGCIVIEEIRKIYNEQYYSHVLLISCTNCWTRSRSIPFIQHVKQPPLILNERGWYWAQKQSLVLSLRSEFGATIIIPPIILSRWSQSKHCFYPHLVG